MTSINPRLADLLPRLDATVARPRVDAAANAARAEAASTSHTTAPDAAHDAPAAAPTLWDLLTEDERAFFKQQMALGPLTYRPGGAVCEPDAGPIGQRIDVTG